MIISYFILLLNIMLPNINVVIAMYVYIVSYGVRDIGAIVSSLFCNGFIFILLNVTILILWLIQAGIHVIFNVHKCWK
jgi:hypothetical protein